MTEYSPCWHPFVLILSLLVRLGSQPLHLSFLPSPNLRERHLQAKSSEIMDGQDTEDPKQSTADMTAFVQTLLQQMQSRFQTMSESIISKIDEMGTRIDELEKSINDLKAEMGPESSHSPLSPAKAETKSADGSA